MAADGSRPEPVCTCVACDAALEVLVLPRLILAVRGLGLADELAAVTLCCDDLPAAGEAGWLRLEASPPPEARPRLELFCAPRVFGEQQPGGGVPPRPVWEQAPAPGAAAAFDMDTFSPAEANAFLHHHLAFAADLLHGRLLPELVPAAAAEAFAAAWDVVVDGRLEREGLPAYDQARRRGAFSRLFSSAGILLPGHWQIFQSLWDGGLGAQTEVLDAVRHLPRL